MTTTPVTPAPIFLNNVTVQIGSDHTFEKAISSLAVVPNSSIVTFQGMSPGAAYSFPTNTTWTVTLTAAQDLKTATSLHNYLLAHAGEQDTLVFTPDNTDDSTVTVTAILVAPQIGGDVNTVGTFSVTFGVQGEPDVVSGS